MAHVRYLYSGYNSYPTLPYFLSRVVYYTLHYILQRQVNEVSTYQLKTSIASIPDIYRPVYTDATV